MRRSALWRRVLSLTLLLVFVVWATRYILLHAEEFRRLAELPIPWVLLSAVALAATIVANGLFFRLTLGAFQIDMRPREWLSLSVMTACVNFVSPLRGGAGARAWYLKERHQMHLADYVTSLGGVLTLILSTHAAIGLIALLSLGLQEKPVDLPLLAFFGTVTLLLGFMVFQTFRLPHRSSFPWSHLTRVVNGWQLIRRNRSLFTWMLLNGLFHFATSMVMFYAAYRAIGVRLGWAEAAFYNASAVTAALLGITPGALGIQEAMSFYMARTLPYTVSEALMAQLLVRFLSILVLVVAAPAAFHFLGTRWSGAFGEKDPGLP